MERRIIFRADGNSDIGLGHVIRSLALVEMLKDNFECVFAIQEPVNALVRQIEAVCAELIILPLDKTDEHLIRELDEYLFGNEIVVLDGYKFTTDYQRHIKEKGCALVCIDDIHAYDFVADVIINHSGGISQEFYRVPIYTQCYLGPGYALLRPDFLKRAKPERTTNSLAKLLINMGAADPNNNLCKILTELPFDSYFKELHIITGLAYKFDDELEKFKIRDKRIRHHKGLTAKQMANVMWKCGAAVCPPSSVAFEYASIGGLLFLFQIAENQREVKSYFIEEKLALDFEKSFTDISDNISFDVLKQILKNQHSIFDGKSGDRLLSIFLRLDAKKSLSIRKAGEQDLLLCFNWANDPDVRSQSYNSDPIPLSQHKAWFQAKISDKQSKYYIVELNDEPVGQIRFDEIESEFVISYLVAPKMRGKGLGLSLLEKGIERLFLESSDVKIVSGYVKHSNIASIRVFEKAGFSPVLDGTLSYPNSAKFVKKAKVYN